jgi:tetratricopeptide (TPR) repeat protein
VLQIGAELIDANRQSEIWGQQFTLQPGDIMFVQRQIAQAISAKLRMHLSQQDTRRLASRYTENEESYELYLKGRFLWNQRTESAIVLAIQDFQQAVAKDPNFAMAYVGLAHCYLILANFTYEPPEEVYPKAEQAAVKALQIDDGLAEAHASLAAVRENYSWDWSGAEVEYKRAIQLDPNYVTAHAWYAMFLEIRGRQKEALQEVRKAQELDPLSLIDNVIAARIFHIGRNYDEAIREVNKTLELDPNYPPALLALGQVDEQKGLFDPAISAFRKAQSVQTNSALVLAALGHCYGVAGRTAEAQQVLQQLEDMAKQRYVAPGDLALVYAGLGNKDEAIRALERSYQERSNWMLFLQEDPRFANLQSDPRFRSLTDRVGLPN